MTTVHGAPPVPELDESSAAARRPSTGSATVELNTGEVLAVERVTALKASRILALLRAVAGKVPELTRELGEFVQAYGEANVLTLDRIDAVRRYPSLADLSDEAWQANGNVLRMRASPSIPEQIAAMLPSVVDVAEDELMHLLALFVLPHREVRSAWRSGGLKELVDERAVELLDLELDELLELAVVCGEVVDDQLRSRVARIGQERLGNALRLVGLGTTPTSPQTAPEASQTTSSEDGGERPTEPTPSSSTDGPANTDGAPATPSTLPSTSSPSSPPSSTTSGPEPRSNGN